MPEACTRRCTFCGIGARPLNREFSPLDLQPIYVIIDFMTISDRHLSDRDKRLVSLVDEFGVLRASHVQQVIFTGLTPKPCQRRLARLDELGLLARFKSSRDSGYEGGGSTGYAYQLGPAGWNWLDKDGTYMPKTSVNKHTLGIADCLVELHRAGLLKPESERVSGVDFRVEPWFQVGDILMKPDAYCTVQLSREVGFLLEVDIERKSDDNHPYKRRRVTTNKQRLLGKMHRYWEAACQGVPMPWVVFCCPDPYRLAYIQRLIRSLPDEQQVLFKATLISDIASAVRSA